MAPYQGDPRWTAYPDAVPTQPLHARHRARRVHLVSLPAAVIALTLGIGGGAAYGYFTSSGSGTGSASTGTMQTVTLATVTQTPSTPLYPGGPAGDVTLAVTNPNKFQVTLVGVAQEAGHNITASGGVGSCSGTGGVTFTNWTGIITITAVNGATQQVDLTGQASMSTSSPTGCQGATFSIPVTITVHTP